MKKVRKRCDTRAWLLYSGLCLLCATSLASVAVGIYNLGNTLGSRARREAAERDSRDLYQKMQGVSREAEELESSISDSMGILSSEIDSIQQRMQQVLDGVRMPIGSKDNQTIVEAISDQNDSTVATVPEVPSDPPTVWVPAYTNCETREHHCTVSGLSISLLGPSNSSVKFSQCSTILTSFIEPGMHVTDVLCHIDQAHGSHPRTSTLRYEEGRWACECYGLAVRSAQFTNFECTMAATLCPKYLAVTQTT